MKKLLVVLWMLLPVAVMAQKKEIRESQVPAAVMKSFTAKFPDTKSREWKEKNGDYEVDFVMGNKEYEAKFQGNGTWKKTSMDISKRDVPEAVTNAWKASQFGKWMLDDAELVETPEYKTLYKLEVVKGLEEMELLFTPSGELLKTKEKNEPK